MANVRDSLPYCERTKLLLEAVIGRDDIPNVLLQLHFDTAVEQADLYINRDFVDRDGNDVMLPAAVKKGVMELVKVYVQEADRDLAVKSVSNLNVSVTYDDSVRTAEQAVFQRYFSQFRRNPGY